MKLNRERRLWSIVSKTSQESVVEIQLYDAGSLSSGMVLVEHARKLFLIKGHSDIGMYHHRGRWSVYQLVVGLPDLLLPAAVCNSNGVRKLSPIACLRANLQLFINDSAHPF